MSRAEAKRYLVEQFLRSFGNRALALYRRFATGPDRRCRTCAFREIETRGVDGWKGWDKSLMGLMRAADPDFAKTKPGQIFVCHRAGKVSGAYAPHKKPRFCAGYAVLAGRPEFKRAVCEAAIRCPGRIMTDRRSFSYCLIHHCDFDKCACPDRRTTDLPPQILCCIKCGLHVSLCPCPEPELEIRGAA